MNIHLKKKEEYYIQVDKGPKFLGTMYYDCE